MSGQLTFVSKGELGPDDLVSVNDKCFIIKVRPSRWYRWNRIDYNRYRNNYYDINFAFCSGGSKLIMIRTIC